MEGTCNRATEFCCPPTMFCLDYGVAFWAHVAFCQYVTPSTEWDGSTALSPLLTFSSGAFAGAVAATSLYPFDLVRQMTVQPGQSHFALSTIPFMTVYFGLYFMQPGNRLEAPLSQRVAWGAGSTAIAALVELPFDHAKINMVGGLRNAAVTAAIRIPLGTFLLVGYDHILTRILQKQREGN
ncbi:hypothetical protein B484DRAFT_454615 [Ochromonadaceae sp. CCMP2298]|nr:hypothetical protein B484DRAFT_454615 [Ochromonadaceae sp. CCMP2298]|mmetsp:Transcript_30480/g.67399  ORF Transcript_30480/g.67399 Transcript_30480/m.67399 type:complete len:182 (+) Transcript_30480:59-604(+)